MLVAWVALNAFCLAVAGYALATDGESLEPLWSVPFQQFVYRQLMYLVIIQAAVTAVTGSRLRWHKLQRTGDFARQTPPPEPAVAVLSVRDGQPTPSPAASTDALDGPSAG